MLEGRGKLVIAVLVLAIAGGTGYWQYASKQKREQQRALVALLGDTTAQLRRALAAPPPPEMLPRIDGNLKLARAPRDPAFADAAEFYIASARDIVRRRADIERLTRESALSRRALAMHMGAASRRDTYWIRVASDLKKRVERDHYELDRSLKSLSELLRIMPDAEKRLQPYVEAALLLEDAERREARERAHEAVKKAADDLEKVRRLEPR